MPTCSRRLWEPRKVLQSLCCLWVVALGMNGRLLFTEPSEVWSCSSGRGLGGTGDHELHGPQVPGPTSRAQTLSPPTAGWGGVWGEEGTPSNASPSGSLTGPGRPSCTGSRPRPPPRANSPAISRHCQTHAPKPRTGGLACSPRCPAGLEEKGTVRALPGRGHAPLPQARLAEPVSMETQGSQRLLAASGGGSGFKTILHDCVCLYYPICAPHPLLR